MAIWLIEHSEETKSPGVVQGDLQAILCFHKHAGFPLGKISLVGAVMKGLLKTLDAKSLDRMGFEPEMVQVLLKLSLETKGIKDFVGLRQAALYVLMYWCITHFEEVQVLTVGSIVK